MDDCMLSVKRTLYIDYIQRNSRQKEHFLNLLAFTQILIKTIA
jgi:hypothetical protein